jgi:SAM-dependent methyltransferase
VAVDSEERVPVGEPAETLAQQRFGRFAQAYVTSVPHAQGEDLDRLLELAQPQADWAMLVAAEAHLTDKGVTNVAFRPAAAEALPFDDASFDLVTCRIAPHHFEDAAAFVHEAARVLKPGGMLLVQDHLMPEDATAARYIEAFEKLRDPSHNRAFTETEWRAMFADAGMTVTHTERVDKVLDFATYADRQGVTPSTRECLIALMQLAPPAVLAWMEPRAWGTPEARYTCRHVIVRGRKGAR